MDVRPHIKSRNHINSKRMSELLCCSQLLSSSPSPSPASSLSRCPSLKSTEMYPRLDTCCCHLPDRDHDMDTFLRHNMMISSERRRRDLASSSSNLTPIKAVTASDTCSRNERYHRRRRESSRVSSFLWSCYSSVASCTTCSSSYSSSSSSSSLPSFSVSSLFHSNFLPTLLTMILIISGLLRFAGKILLSLFRLFLCLLTPVILSFFLRLFTRVVRSFPLLLSSYTTSRISSLGLSLSLSVGMSLSPSLHPASGRLTNIWHERHEPCTLLHHYFCLSFSARFKSPSLSLFLSFSLSSVPLSLPELLSPNLTKK